MQFDGKESINQLESLCRQSWRGGGGRGGGWVGGRGTCSKALILKTEGLCEIFQRLKWEAKWNQVPGTGDEHQTGPL